MVAEPRRLEGGGTSKSSGRARCVPKLRVGQNCILAEDGIGVRQGCILAEDGIMKALCVVSEQYWGHFFHM